MNSVLKPEYFINRELSWLEFNARVLEEAQDPSTPLLDRVKFLSIFSSNLDEFFMVRVAGLREQAFGDGAPQDFNPDGLNSIGLLKEISERTRVLVTAQYQCFSDLIVPELAQQGIRIVAHEEVAKSKSLEKFFSETVFPIVTPMAIDPSHPRPRYHNRGLYVAATLRRRKGLGPKHMFAVVQLPQVLPRLVPVIDRDPHTFITVEDLVAARLPELFGGFDVISSCSFRITRDSDLDVLEQESDDMLRMIEERLRRRRKADAVRLEITATADEELYQTIQRHEQLRDGKPSGYSEVYRIPGPIDLTGLMELVALPHLEHLHDATFTPQIAPGLRRHGEDVFDAIRRRDVLLHHPFDDFRPVVDFIQLAAQDPNVLAIKQTLYRTSGDSPIVRALMQAADSGKHVTALVELKARFDEAANVDSARRMESSGVHVVYGFMDLKTHTKVAMVARREGHGVRQYVHLSTGNYNPTTARIYTDLGLFTCDEDICADVSALFNMLTGYSQGHVWRKVIVAPDFLHQETVKLIDEQTSRAERGKPARIVAKLNALVDHRVIEALYRASQAGTKIDLILRGICCLRPGIPGVSDNISVISIVDRFLEHSRIFVFGEGDSAKVFLSSADWMPRNFYRRVEIMFPIESLPLKKRILREILPAYFQDNVRTRILQSDGSYVRKTRASDEPPFRCQHELLQLPHIPEIARPAASPNGEDTTDPKGKKKQARESQVVCSHLAQSQLPKSDQLARILITSGPTRQYLDPVRFLTNASSGRMGCALAEAALARKHEVVVVSGPVDLDYPEAATLFSVTSTEEMLEVARGEFAACAGVIGVAAPCDYRPLRVADQKISKTGDGLMLQLVETEDVIATLGVEKQHRWVVGFALETEDHRFRAITKAEKKSCDLMILNSPAAMHSLNTDVEVLDRMGRVLARHQGSKLEVSRQVFGMIEELLIEN